MSRIIRCTCCGKQAIKNQNPSMYDRYTTKLEGSVADFGGDVICGYCAQDLDEYGLFPNELSMLTEDQLEEYDGKYKCLTKFKLTYNII